MTESGRSHGGIWPVSRRNLVSNAKFRYQGGVHLQDGRTQGQNVAQNGSQKPFCNGPEASDLVTKISTGMTRAFLRR